MLKFTEAILESEFYGIYTIISLSYNSCFAPTPQRTLFWSHKRRIRMDRRRNINVSLSVEIPELV